MWNIRRRSQLGVEAGLGGDEVERSAGGLVIDRTLANSHQEGNGARDWRSPEE